MNNKIVRCFTQTFVRRGFATLRFNFRGVGKSQGVFDNGIGELSDALRRSTGSGSHPEAETTWSRRDFGAGIGMQLLMRRPEIKGLSRSRRQPTCTTSASLPPPLVGDHHSGRGR